MKSFQSVDGRQVAQGISQFDQFTVDLVPIACGAHHAPVPTWRDSDAGLCDGVGQGIDGAMGENVLLGNLQRGVAGGERKQPSDGHGGSDIERISTEKKVISLTGL
jgi:hypothetical protein